MDELIKFTQIREGKVKVEVWGDSVTDYGVMEVNGMTPFLQKLQLIATTPEEVIQELSKGKDFDRFIKNRTRGKYGMKIVDMP